MVFLFNNQLKSIYQSQAIIKVISGLDNNNIVEIIKMAKAAEIAGATYLDIIANPRIVSILKSFINLPICISSIDPLELYNCVLMGADIVELGNFDILYNKNIFLSIDEICSLAIETRSLLPYTDICVTIPYQLSLDDQVELAQRLEDIGVNILQTEGFNKLSNKLNQNIDYLYLSTSKASASLSSTYALSQSVSLPIITASRINSISSSVAISYGAHGIGIGSAFKQYVNIVDMSSNMLEIVNSLQYQKYFTCTNHNIVYLNSLHSYKTQSYYNNLLR